MMNIIVLVELGGIEPLTLESLTQDLTGSTTFKMYREYPRTDFRNGGKRERTEILV